MSKIQQITSSQPRVSNHKNAKQNFSGKLNDAQKSSKEVLDPIKKTLLDGVEAKLDKDTGKLAKIFQWLADTKGEVQTQTINGIFTTTLAPLMIVFNPFTKNKTKEDKEYLALRQPISAIIALSGGVAMTMGINKFLDKVYNDGNVKSIDLRLAPSKEYIKKPFEKAFKDAKKNNTLDEFLALYNKDVSSIVKENGFKENGKIKSSYLRECFKQGYSKQVSDQRTALFTTLISQEPTKIKVDAAGNIMMGDKNLQEGHLLKVPNFNTQPQLDEYIEKNSLHNRTLGELMSEKFKFEFFEDGTYKTGINDKHLSETKALDFLEEIGLIEEKSVTETELKEILLKYRQNLHREEYAKIHGISLEKAEQALNLIGSDTSRNIQMTVGEDIGKAKSISLGQFFHQLGYKTSDGSLQEFMGKHMSESLMDFQKIFAGKLKGINDKTELKDFAKNFIKRTAGRMSKDAGTHKFYVGIVTNLFTTAITCTILNWTYPRLVEALFPSLVKPGAKPIPPGPPELQKQIEAKKGGNK